ncbi:MAG: phosphoribosylanthranilate isomerase [Gammaproteobacteria bacterium]|nr:phosphoribosylanthranilate isomerase [Gammaproteobacteria bacterium]
MSFRTRVKICGITRVEDALAVSQSGVDAIGLVFYDKSPRNIGMAQAQAICEALPAFVTVVALFKDPEDVFVRSVIEQVPIDLLQFHGRETAAFCQSFKKPYIKAVGMEGQHDVSGFSAQYRSARGLLLDSHAIGEDGGSGHVFDWGSIPTEIRSQITLAGGLNADNIASAIKQVRPFAVDISSGVESSGGIKDEALIKALMNEVKRVDCEHD